MEGTFTKTRPHPHTKVELLARLGSPGILLRKHPMGMNGDRVYTKFDLLWDWWKNNPPEAGILNRVVQKRKFDERVVPYTYDDMPVLLHLLAALDARATEALGWAVVIYQHQIARMDSPCLVLHRPRFEASVEDLDTSPKRPKWVTYGPLSNILGILGILNYARYEEFQRVSGWDVA